MKKTRFNEEQIIRILKQAEQGQKAIRDVCRQHGICEQTFYRWRRKYGGLSESEATRLKRLERENARLKMLVADRDLEVEVLRDVVRKKS